MIVAGAIEIHVASGGRGSLLTVVDEILLPPHQDRGETAPAEVTGFGIGNRQGEADRDRSVDGIATRLEDFPRRLRAVPVGSCDRRRLCGLHRLQAGAGDQDEQRGRP